MKEQQAREEMAQQKEELEKRLTEFQDEANRSKEALVNIFNLQSWKSQSCCRLTPETELLKRTWIMRPMWILLWNRERESQKWLFVKTHPS